MNRKLIARHAFNTAIDRVTRDASLSPAEKRVRFFRLSSAYEARRSQLDLAAWVEARGLGNIINTSRRAA